VRDIKKWQHKNEIRNTPYNRCQAVLRMGATSVGVEKSSHSVKVSPGTLVRIPEINGSYPGSISKPTGVLMSRKITFVRNE
jgi:hypothetical protein